MDLILKVFETSDILRRGLIHVQVQQQFLAMLSATLIYLSKWHKATKTS